MTDFNQASDVLERFGNQWAGVLEAAAALKALGGMDAQAKSLNAQVTNLGKQAEAATEELTNLNTAIAEAAHEYDSQCKKQKEELAKRIQDANDQAVQIVSDANTKAEQIMVDANAKAEEKIHAAGLTVASLQAKADDIDASLKKATDARDAAQAEFDELNAKLTAARAAARQMMEGA